LPGRGRGGEMTLQPACLPVSDRVRIEHEEVEVGPRPLVMGRRYAKRLELVAAAVDAHIVVPEGAARPDARSLQPAERVAPVAAKRRRALGVVVVPEREEDTRRVVCLPGL